MSSPLNNSKLRSFQFRAAGVILGLLSAALIGEVALRVGREHLPPRMAGFISNCYDSADRVNGIYYMDPRFGLTLPRPDFSTVCSWNGITWRHQGDHRGFRNPQTYDTADIAMLGDSIVYGHGVEEPDTIAAQLRSRTGTTVANFGVTGASPVHYLAFARNYALRVHPKALVVVVFANDLTEIPLQRNADEIARFNHDAAGREMQVFQPDALAKFAPRPSLSRALSRSVFLRSVLYGMHAVSERSRMEAPEPEPTRPEVSDLEQRFGSSVAYLRKMLGVLATATNRARAHLLVLYVPAVQGTYALENRELPSVLSKWADQGGYLFVDTTAALMDGPDREKPGTRLPRDGHLTGRGAGLVADLIAARLHEAEQATAPLGVKLSLGSPWIQLTDFWDLESDAAGSYAWTKGESAFELTGLPAHAAMKLSLYVRHIGPSGDLRITNSDGWSQQLSVTANQKCALPGIIRADDRGHLLLRLAVHSFRPSDQGASNDHRELGIGLSGVEVEMIDGEK